MTEELTPHKRRRLRILLWVLFTPVALFILLMVLLYVPPVQDFIRRKATQVASEATGMQISVDRIDLRFPLNLLVRGVSVVQPADSVAGILTPDTLLQVERLDVQVQAWPLIRGQVEVDGITLEQVRVNSSNLVEGMQVQGVLGRFFLKSHGIDLLSEAVTLNDVELSDTHVDVCLTDTTPPAPEDTTQTALKWKFLLHRLALKNVSANLRMPLDSLSMQAGFKQLTIDEARADLGLQTYGAIACNWTALPCATTWVTRHRLLVSTLHTLPCATCKWASTRCIMAAGR